MHKKIGIGSAFGLWAFHGEHGPNLLLTPAERMVLARRRPNSGNTRLDEGLVIIAVLRGFHSHGVGWASVNYAGSAEGASQA